MSRSARSDLVDMELHLHHETSLAVFVSETGDRAQAVWLPTSQCEVERLGGNRVSVTLPERLATEKGLI